MLRLYEAKRADTACALTVKFTWTCDMLKNRLEPLPIERRRADLNFHTFEVKMLRLEF